jgi:hypothetical protein
MKLDGFHLCEKVRDPKDIGKAEKTILEEGAVQIPVVNQRIPILTDNKLEGKRYSKEKHGLKIDGRIEINTYLGEGFVVVETIKPSGFYHINVMYDITNEIARNKATNLEDKLNALGFFGSSSKKIPDSYRI